jgi:hypothetical protein
MSSNLRNRKLFSQPRMDEVETAVLPEGLCLGSGSKVKYSHPDDVPAATEDGTPLRAYLCDFCGSWHATSKSLIRWRKRRRSV